MNRSTILIVDDMEVNRAILRELVNGDFAIQECSNGQEAMDIIHSIPEEIAVILLDIIMPVMDGFSVLKELKKEDYLKDIPVILITSENSSSSEIKAFDSGASDMITKPFNPHIVKRRVYNIIELYRHKNHLEELVEQQTRKLVETNNTIIDALSTIIEYRSMESGQHNRRIRMFTKIMLNEIAQLYLEYELTQSEIDLISSAAAMHDIGKIAIPDAVLNKPGKLTTEEFELMKTHTTKGCEILMTLNRLENKKYLKYCYEICRYHHERWDGRGYPDKLKGDEIPICAQAVAIADVYDALTTARVYKPAYVHKQAVQMILNGECGIFSPKLMVCFKNVCSQFEALAADYADGKELDSEFFYSDTMKNIKEELL